MRPNIVVIICDDLAYGDLGCHGNPHVRTQALDSLASSGVAFDRYCSGPLCTPARAALMTGRHPLRTGAIDTYLGRSILHPDEVTLAEELRNAGYRTGLFGKWHLGDCYPFRPNDRGFEESLSHRGGGLRQPCGPGPGSYFNPELERNGEAVQSRGYCTDIFFEAAIEWISSLTTTDEPFFLYLAPNAPHSPFEVPEAFVERFRSSDLPEQWARLYGMIENIDQNVQRLIDALELLNEADNTLFLFTSDHGPCGSACSDDGAIRYNAGLRGMKGSFYEGGIRVPCIWNWKGAIPENRRIPNLANVIDVFPTLLEAAQVSRDGSASSLDGCSMWPTITGGKLQPFEDNREICMQWHRGNRPVKGLNAAVMTDRYKWILHSPDSEPELYDLSEDPAEENNISRRESGLCEHYRRTYNEWFDEVCSDSSRYDPARIVLGADASKDVLLTPQDWRLDDDAPEPIWSAINPGVWYLRMLSEGPWNIQIDLPMEAVGAPVRIRVGDWDHTTAPMKGLGNLEMRPSFSISLTDIRLPIGDVCLSVSWRHSGDTPASAGGPFFVRFSAGS